MKVRINVIEPLCVHCGCSEHRGCPNGCWWITVNRQTGHAICSNCVFEQLLESRADLPLEVQGRPDKAMAAGAR